MVSGCDLSLNASCPRFYYLRRPAFSLWWGWRDSNSQGLPHTALNRTRIPVPPHPHRFTFSKHNYFSLNCNLSQQQSTTCSARAALPYSRCLQALSRQEQWSYSASRRYWLHSALAMWQVTRRAKVTMGAASPLLLSFAPPNAVP